MNAKIEWDTESASAETADLTTKLLNTVVPLYNELQDVEAKYQAANDAEGAVQAAIENATDEESVTLKAQIEKAQALIAHHTAALEEKARKTVMDSIDPEYDEAKVIARHNDLRNELRDKGTNIRGTFKILGFVSSEVSTAGRESNFKGENGAGELLLKVLSVPKLGKAESTSSKTDPAVAEFNKNAKAWAKENGMEVAEKGALSNAVKEAYTKATGIAQP
jgi:hypothetical protein